MQYSLQRSDGYKPVSAKTNNVGMRTASPVYIGADFVAHVARSRSHLNAVICI